MLRFKIGEFILQKEIGFSFFIIIQQMNGLQSFFQVIHHIIVEVGFQYIFYGCPVFFLNINDIA